MKSGQVLTDRRYKWFEPEYWRFGDPASAEGQINYMRHASGQVPRCNSLSACILTSHMPSLSSYHVWSFRCRSAVHTAAVYSAGCITPSVYGSGQRGQDDKSRGWARLASARRLSRCLPPVCASARRVAQSIALSSERGFAPPTLRQHDAGGRARARRCTGCRARSRATSGVTGPSCTASPTRTSRSARGWSAWRSRTSMSAGSAATPPSAARRRRAARDARLGCREGACASDAGRLPVRTERAPQAGRAERPCLAPAPCPAPVSRWGRGPAPSRVAEQ